MVLGDIWEVHLDLREVELLQRFLAEAATSAPTLAAQVRHLVFGEPVCTALLPDVAWARPTEDVWLAVLEQLRREEASETLLLIEEILFDRGWSRWVYESQLEALLEATIEWKHPAGVLGLSYNRARVHELAALLRKKLEGDFEPYEQGAAVLQKLEATVQLEARAAGRRAQGRRR